MCDLDSIEWFSFECRKTKTKVITLTNHNSRKQSNEPIRARNKYMSPVPSAEKRVRVKRLVLVLVLVLVLLLIGRGSGARFCNQSQSVAMQNQSNCGITFDTQLKSALSEILQCSLKIHKGQLFHCVLVLGKKERFSEK